MKSLTIEICEGTSCQLLGSQDLHDAVSGLPQDKRERIDLCEAVCLKSCQKGPSVRMNGIVLSDMTPEHLVEVIEETLARD